MSTESHYNALRTRAEDAESIVRALEALHDAATHGEDEPAAVRETVMSPFARGMLASMLAERMTECSESAWPSVRAGIAGEGMPMPSGPSTYSARTGALWHSLGGGFNIYRIGETPFSEREHSPLVGAAASLLPNARMTADHARSTFERYRQAVVQGVALDPEERCDSSE